jgi:hypothetical protein
MNEIYKIKVFEDIIKAQNKLNSSCLLIFDAALFYFSIKIFSYIYFNLMNNNIYI